MGKVPSSVFEAYAPLQGNSQTLVQGTTNITWPDTSAIEWSAGVAVAWENQTTFFPDTQVSANIPTTVFLGVEG